MAPPKAAAEQEEEEKHVYGPGWIFEAAKSGKAVCHECDYHIEEGEIKIKNTLKKSQQKSGASYHVKCISQEMVNSVLESYTNGWEKVPGYKLLSDDETKKIKNLVAEE